MAANRTTAIIERDMPRLNGNEIFATALCFGLVYGIIEMFSENNNDTKPT